MEMRASVEEDLLTRVRLSKDEAARLKGQRRAGMSAQAMMADFADEVRGGPAQGAEEGRHIDLYPPTHTHKAVDLFADSVPLTIHILPPRLASDSVAHLRQFVSDPSPPPPPSLPPRLRTSWT